MSPRNMIDTTPSPRLLQVLGEIPLDPWQCLAELIDNSLDELLKLPDRDSDNPLEVDISIEEQDNHHYLIVKDNGLGMNEKELERSLKAGHSGKNRYGSLGLFGMGFNIATARLGNVTEVSTSVPGSKELLKTTIDFRSMQEEESFEVPLERSGCKKDYSGTEVKVLLKKSQVEGFTNANKVKGIRHKLGEVYSYLLRSGVPGLSKNPAPQIPAVLCFKGKSIEPRLPCIWNDQRSTKYLGQEISAVQYIDKRLPVATACLDCGHWDRMNGPEKCVECDSTRLEEKERRIWGWLGVQRYLDTNHYGIDFLRYGRKILVQDTSIFEYEDPDTLARDREYPIEMPMRDGRIVGEVHLDHVAVTYQKNDFIRNGRDWKVAMQVIRGDTPLKPKTRSEMSNTSPLAKIFCAFRRNDPGVTRLTPGNGQKAIHAAAKRYATSFYKGLQDYQDDSLWYKDALSHDQIKARLEGDDPAGDPAPTGDSEGGIDDILGGGRDTPEEPVEPTPTITGQEKNQIARDLGTVVRYLTRPYKLSRQLGNWELIVVNTRAVLKSPSGSVIPVKPGDIQGKKIEVLVSGQHSIFTEFGRDLQDVALIEAATLIQGLTVSGLSIASIYSELVHETIDLKVTENSLLERSEVVLSRVRELLLPIVTENTESAESFWSILEREEKTRMEDLSAVKFPHDRFKDLVADGRFIELCDAGAIAKIVSEKAPLLFDSVVFRAAYEDRSPQSQVRLVSQVTMTLENIKGFSQDPLMRERHDRQVLQISLDRLEDQLIGEE